MKAEASALKCRSVGGGDHSLHPFQGGRIRNIKGCGLTAVKVFAQIPQVSRYFTGQPEMQGGLVKTLDFKIYLGLLSEKYNDAHQADLKRLSAQPIDMVVVNLYPFRQTVAKEGVTPEMARTNIDIGGPCMVRASAKNYLRVASVTDPLDYPSIAQELESRGGTIGLDTRFKLMKKAFSHTAEYDTAIAKFFTTRTWEEVDATYSQH